MQISDLLMILRASSSNPSWKNTPKPLEYHGIRDQHGSTTLKKHLKIILDSDKIKINILKVIHSFCSHLNNAASYVACSSYYGYHVKIAAHSSGSWGLKCQYQECKFICILVCYVACCRFKCASIPDGVLDFYLSYQEHERAPLLLSIQSKTGKTVNCMTLLPLML